MTGWVQRSLVVLALLVAGLTPTRPASGAERLVVASKKFPESSLLGELLAQALERRGIEVERRFNLGNTAVAFAALRRGSVDIYPEYTGTALGLLDLDRQKVERHDVVGVLRRQLAARYGLYWGPPLGFDNSYAIAVRRSFAEQHGLETLTDLGRLSQQTPVRFAVSHEFLSREDGYQPLAQRYGFRGSVRGAEHAVSYQLLDSDQADALDVYTTEALIEEHSLLVLDDDAGFFPPYEASFIYGSDVAHSALALDALIELSGLFDDRAMRTLNRSVEVEGLPVSRVASEFAQRWFGGSASAAAPEPARKQLTFGGLLWHDRFELLRHLGRHLELTLMAMALCLLVGIPLGYLATRGALGAALTLGVTGALQTIPSLALLVLAIPLVAAVLTPLGQSSLVLGGSALLALFLYALLPVVRNTKQGLEGIDRSILEAGRGTGMTERQVLWWIQLPLALPVMLAGIRTSFVITVGTATLAAFVGAGGLGVPIISGLSVQNYTEVWTGAVPAALLALFSDAGFAVLQRALTRRLLGRSSDAK